MAAQTSPEPRAGLVVSVVGDRYIFLATGNETGGAFAAFEFHIPAGNGPPLHMHHREAEFFFVLDGEFEFHVGGRTLRRKAGESLLALPEIAHRFVNVGAGPGRLLCTATPAGMDEFFCLIGTELADANAEPIPPTPADFARIMEIAPRFGIEIFPQGRA